MRLDDKDRISMDECRIRALRYLAKQVKDRFASASDVGNAIWPNSEMRAQGLGGAASRVLKTLQRDGLAKWGVDGTWWGWLITPAGRKKALEGRNER